MQCFQCKTNMHQIGDEVIKEKNIHVYIEICPECESDAQIFYKTMYGKEKLHKVLWREYEII